MPAGSEPPGVPARPAARARRSRGGRLALALAALGALAVGLALSGADGRPRGGTLTAPVDRAQQLALAFGDRSHWLQPWRAWLDTVPARRLLGAVGIQFDVDADQAPAVARLLARDGFSRARVEIGWGQVDPSDENRLLDEDQVRARLIALRDNHIRPLILLNGYHGEPAPLRRFTARLVLPAAAGARRVTLDAATARQVVPGRSGLDGTDSDGTSVAASVLFTGVTRYGEATLSRPLPGPLGAGGHPATTLSYAPFGGATFEDTMSGWLHYVGVVTSLARSIFGQRFDVEVWNELTFGSSFLDINRYYAPAIAPESASQDQDNCEELVRRTVAFVRDRSHRVSGIGVGDGCANTIPWPAGSTAPRGLTAIDKHPYPLVVPYAPPGVVSNQRPLDARGRPDGTQDDGGMWHERFTPTYDALFPEYFLTGLQTETVVRDLSPYTTRFGDAAHGRLTHPPGGAPPVLWVTEIGVNAGALGLAPRDAEHLKAKAALRALVAYAGKGARAVFLFAARHESYDLVDPAFLDAAGASPGAAPDPALAGEAPAAVGRFVRAFAGARRLARVRPLSLLAVTDSGGVQFSGDGTAAHPALHDREVTAFFPFQVGPRRWVVAAYVMTRDLAHLYRPGAPAGDPARYDMPPEAFTLQVGGVRARVARVRALDPLSGRTVAVRVAGRRGGRLALRLGLTDSPRLITIDG